MKPYVILNAAMTLDGKIATKTGSSKISGKKDMVRVHQLRKDMDGIIVGIGTVLADDPKLTVSKIDALLEDNPIRIVVDSQGRTPINSRVLNKMAPTIIAVSGKYSDTREIKELSKKADIFVSGKEHVDLSKLLDYLYSQGIKTLMLEGGSTLNFSMIKEGLIDEIRICIGPMIVGGNYAKTLFDGEGFDFMEDSVKLDLININQLDQDLILTYKIIK
ncbi:2,5-diamino-6-(ribosylamino)-4(3H)-pyrimidinone 5'-phosphate reductase [uncultured Methanobrevibacter sp.]|uniref:2,5-diamino-6-(ribosylamino)-4(3H)-pyrimidinone 5'-phosphate reductase n=1 Tax=uncultured Methanobrevibacter sp. TaxID=253161 RepID=UPI0025DE7E9D|nr:2,5-diamino-6-(ribosylamino)-4(3H)-pyrimidinone 5'-phosphate reductase [uncultured Methanobrevibacter sp.]